MDKLDKIEQKIDQLHLRFDEVIVKTEGRLTSLEHKIGPVLWGVTTPWPTRPTRRSSTWMSTLQTTKENPMPCGKKKKGGKKGR
jgi:hypothetical protein